LDRVSENVAERARIAIVRVVRARIPARRIYW
jgi:hypothetical protein